MMLNLSRPQARYLRLRAQRLPAATKQAPSNVPQIVLDLCGIQAQEPRSAALAVRVRGTELSAGQVAEALAVERTIVRTWCMRGTLHWLATEDLSWLLPLLGPPAIKKSRRRYEQLGLDEALYARALEAVRGILHSHAPLTRAQLAGQLAEKGISTEGQVAYHLLRRAGLEGVVCFGPDFEREPTYVLVDNWLDRGETLPPEVARTLLARRYLEAYGPATPRDLATWSGASIKEARAGFDSLLDELLELTIDDSPAWHLQSRASWLDETPRDQPMVHLLPAYDPYLLGYHGRELTVPERWAKRLHPGGGLIRPAILADGQAVGTWKLEPKKDKVVVRLEPFEELSAAVTPALDQEVKDIGRFFDLPATLSLTG